MTQRAPRLPWLDPDAGPDALPDAEAALKEPAGLVAAGGRLTPDWLLGAYRRGIFPWFSEGEPILWWSPDPRCVIEPDRFRRHRSLVKAARNRGYEVRTDTAFTAIVDGCAAPRDGAQGTWITAPMRAAYAVLHELGSAHSVEVWNGECLVGGLYGVRLGGVFFGESMYSLVPDASKIALLSLVERAKGERIALIDCQFPTPHLLSLGASVLSRADFLARVRALVDPA